MNILNVGYASANYYLLEPDRASLLVDVGWPGTLPMLLAVLRRKGVAFEQIRYLLATHYHPDHAGLAQELQEQGVRLIVMESQVDAIPILGSYMKPGDPYREIRLDEAIRLSAGESRAFLRSIGLGGEVVPTPGHSDDSASLVLDEGLAFTGDLTHPMMATDEARGLVEQSWAKLRALGVNTVYPGHGPVWQLA